MVLAHDPPGTGDRSQLRVSAGLAPASPAPAAGICPASGTAQHHPGLRATAVDRHPRGMRSAAATARPWHAVAWLLWAVAGACTVQLAPSPVYVALVIGIAWLVVEAARARRPVPARLPDPAHGRRRLRVDPRRDRRAHRARRHRRAHDAARGHVPRLLGGFTRRRDRRGRRRAPGARRGLHDRRHDGGVRRVQRDRVALRAGAVVAARVPRARAWSTTVALAFVPSTIESVFAVREADRARTGGQSVKRGRLLRSVVPVLERGLERAVALSESMDARGFGYEGDQRGPTSRRAGAGWARSSRSAARSSRSSAGPARGDRPRARRGSCCSSPRSRSRPGSTRDRRRYRRRRMTRPDWVMVGSRAPVAAARRHHRARAATTPSPGTRARRHWPTFNPARGGCAAPPPRPAGTHPQVGTRPRGGPGRDARRRPGPGDRPVSAISFTGVSFGYPDGPLALDAVDLDVRAGRDPARRRRLRLGQEHVAPRRRTGSSRTRPAGGSPVTSSRSVARPAPTSPASSPTSSGSSTRTRRRSSSSTGSRPTSRSCSRTSGCPTTTMRRRVEEVLDALGIAHLRDRNPATLSRRRAPAGRDRRRAGGRARRARARRADVAARPAGRRRRARRDRPAQRRPRHDGAPGRAPPRTRRAARGPGGRRARGPDRRRARRAEPTCSPSYPGAPSVTRLGRLLGWDPPPLTVRDARAHALRDGAPTRARPASSIPT